MAFLCPSCKQTLSDAQGIQAGYQCPQCGVFLVRTATGPANRAPAAVSGDDILATPTTQEAEAAAAEAAAPPPPDPRVTFIRPTDPRDPAARARALRANLDLHWQRQATEAPASGNGNGNGNGSGNGGAPGNGDGYGGSQANGRGHAAVSPTRIGQSVVMVSPSSDNERDATAMEQILLALSGLPSTVSLELVGEPGRRRLLVRGEKMSVDFIRKQLLNVYGQVAVEPVAPENDPAEIWANARGATQAVRLTASGPAFLPIKTWIEFNGADPLLNLLAPFDQLKRGELALSQLVIHGPAPAGWAKPHLTQIVNRKMRGFMGETIPMAKGFKIAALIFLAVLGLGCAGWALVGTMNQDWLAVGLGAAALMGCYGGAKWLWDHLNDNPWAQVLDDEATNKLRDTAFQVDVRLYTLAPDMARAKELKGSLVTAYHTFSTNSGNRMREVPLDHPDPTELPSLAEGDHVPGASYLSVKEMAGLWHMPVGVMLEQVKRQGYERVLPLPEQVSQYGGCPIGVSVKDGNEVPVLLPAAAMERNMFVIGKTQHGKTNLMEHVAAYWAADPQRALVVVDPHGDMARRMIGLVPPERAHDVIYIDLANTERAVGLNLLDVSKGARPDQIAEDFVDVGKALWQNFWGPRMLIPLHFGLRALAHANTNRAPDNQYTILALAQMLNANSKQRMTFLTAELGNRDETGIVNYFTGEYDTVSAGQREQVIAPVLSKAHAFERTDIIKRLVGQPRSTVNLYEALRAHKIIILNCNAGLLHDDLAGFIGSLFINIIRSVIMQQAGLPREQRVRVGVIADEFQKLEGVKFGALLGEMQKFGATFLLGTQSLEALRQVEESRGLPEQLLANVSTIFALQVNGDDALYLTERELGYKRLSPESLTSIRPYHAYIKTVSNAGETIPVFSARIAPPRPVDGTMVATVKRLSEGYTVTAHEADDSVVKSLSLFMNRYTRTDDGSLPFGDQDQAATASQAGQVLAQAAQPVGGADSVSPLTSTVLGPSLRNPHPVFPRTNPIVTTVNEDQSAAQASHAAGTASVAPAITVAARPKAKRTGGKKGATARAATPSAAPGATPAAAPAPAQSASVPVMMTRSMRDRLTALGHTEAEIDAMTPQQAHDRLNQATAAPASASSPAPAAPDPDEPPPDKLWLLNLGQEPPR